MSNGPTINVTFAGMEALSIDHAAAAQRLATLLSPRLLQPTPPDNPRHMRATMDVVLPEGLDRERVRLFLHDILQLVETQLQPGQHIAVAVISSDEPVHSVHLVYPKATP